MTSPPLPAHRRTASGSPRSAFVGFSTTQRLKLPTFTSIRAEIQAAESIGVSPHRTWQEAAEAHYKVLTNSHEQQRLIG